MLARTSQDIAYPSGCPSPVGRSPSGNQPCGHSRCTIPAGHSPAPVLVRSLRTSSCFLCPANGFTGRMTNLHLMDLLSCLFVSFPSQRCETYSFRPHLLSSKKCGPTWLTFRFRSLYASSSQVATKLIYDCLELPANLAGSCSESLMLVIRQKYGTSCPTFLLAAIIRAKLARIITSDQLDPKLQVRVMRTNLVHIIHFRPTWAEVPYPCYL